MKFDATLQPPAARRRDTTSGHMKVDGFMTGNVAAYSACTTVLEGDVSKAKREASVEWWKKITEAVHKDLGGSSENQLAKEENENAKL